MRVRVALNRLKDFLFACVYQGSAAKAEVDKAQRLLIDMFAYYVAHPGEIGEEARRSKSIRSARMSRSGFVPCGLRS